MARVKLYRNLVADVTPTPAVRAALRARGQAIAARADQIAATDGHRIGTEVREDRSREGRARVRVVSADGDSELGTYEHGRLRILGRAADVEI